MSDDFIVLVPSDPDHIPSPEAQQRVAAILRRLAPSAESITPEVSEVIRLHDCGENFESIRCPRCGAEISIDWWQEHMDEDFDGKGFRMGSYTAPCCGASMTLNDLAYDWPQAWGRSSWTVQNPDIDDLDAGARSELEGAAGVPLVVVRRRI